MIGSAGFKMKPLVHASNNATGIGCLMVRWCHHSACQRHSAFLCEVNMKEQQDHGMAIEGLASYHLPLLIGID